MLGPPCGVSDDARAPILPLMPRAKKAGPAPDAPTEAPDAAAPAADDAVEADADVLVDPVVPVTEDDEDEEDEEDEVVVEDDVVEDEVVAKPVAARPASRPSPGRPPGAKEEPDPPFYIGERIRLTNNLRPRTGVPIGDYPIGAEGRVETVLSLTCIIRFLQAMDTREVVAFTNIESIDPECIARRAERDRLKAAAEAEIEKEKKAAEKAAEKA